jgi:excisionase family DNA binding protein
VTGTDFGVGVYREGRARWRPPNPGGTVTSKRIQNRLLSTDEVAELLAVSPKTVRRWISEGELPAVKLHRQWRIRAAELDRQLEGKSDSDAA